MKGSLVISVSVCAFLAGCTGDTTAPFKTPLVAPLYKVPGTLLGKPACDEIKGSTPCADPYLQAWTNAQALAVSAAGFAKDVDDNARFKVWNDLTSLGLLAGAGIGALTNAHSDLYKSAGALLGLNLGLDAYLKPEQQRDVYLNAADAASCSARKMQAVSRLITQVQSRDIQAVRNQLPENERALKTVLYSTDLQTRLAALNNPFLVAKVINAGLAADNDAEATEKALDFLANLDDVGFDRRKLITMYTVSEIYKVAYKRDAALAVIGKVSVTPTELLKQMNAANLARTSIPTPSPGVTQLNNNLSAIVSAINEFNGCVKTLSDPGQAQ